MSISEIIRHLIAVDDDVTSPVTLSQICCALFPLSRRSRRTRLLNVPVQPQQGAEVCESRVLLSAVTGQYIQPSVELAGHHAPQSLSAVEQFPAADTSTRGVRLPAGEVSESDESGAGVNLDDPIHLDGNVTVSLPANDEADARNDHRELKPDIPGFSTNEATGLEPLGIESPGNDDNDPALADSVIYDVVFQLLSDSGPSTAVSGSPDSAAGQSLSTNAGQTSASLVDGDADAHSSSVPPNWKSRYSPHSGQNPADEVSSSGIFSTAPTAITETRLFTERSDTRIRNSLGSGIPASGAINGADSSLSELLDTLNGQSGGLKTRQSLRTVAHAFSSWPIPSAGTLFSQEWTVASQRAGQHQHQRYRSLIDKGSHLQPEVLPSESISTGRLVKQQEAMARLLRHAVREATSHVPLPLDITPGDNPDVGSRSIARQRTLRYEIQPRAPPASEQPGVQFVSRYGHADLLRRLRFSIAPRGPSLASTVCVKSVSDTFRSLSDTFSIPA